MVKLNLVKSSKQIKITKELFKEYAESLEINLDFQDFEREFKELPGEYSPPSDRLILAYDNSKPAGCVALKKLTIKICEMKRLFVRPEFRGKGIGKILTKKLLLKL